MSAALASKIAVKRAEHACARAVILCETREIRLSNAPEAPGAIFSAGCIRADTGSDLVLALITGGSEIIHRHAEYAQAARRASRGVGLTGDEQWCWHEQCRTLAGGWCVGRVRTTDLGEGTCRYIRDFLFEPSRRPRFTAAPENWTQDLIAQWAITPIERLLREIACFGREAWEQRPDAARRRTERSGYAC